MNVQIECKGEQRLRREINFGSFEFRDGVPVAEALYRLRRQRERMFATGLFSEPTWDVLLDLFAAEKAGKRVSITSACIAATAPTSTALRTLRLLEQQGILQREPDPRDGRRTYICLSSDTLAMMECIFEDFFDLLAKSLVTPSHQIVNNSHLP